MLYLLVHDCFLYYITKLLLFPLKTIFVYKKYDHFCFVGSKTSFCFELYVDFAFFCFEVRLENKKCDLETPHKIRIYKENTIVIRT